MAEIALAQLGRLKPLKQMVLKYAAIIGPVFTTQLLAHILPTSVRHKMNCLLDMLVSDNILEWVTKTGVTENTQGHTKAPDTFLQEGRGKWQQ